MRVLILALFVALTLSQTIPDTPTQFQANVQITLTGMFPTTTSGVIYYDYINQRQRIEQTQFGDKIVEVDLFNSMTSYQWDTLAGRCQCSNLKDPMSPCYIPYGSSFEGNANVNGVNTQVWSLNDPIMQASGMYITFFVNSDSEVIRVNTTINMPPLPAQTTLMDLSNYVVGPPAASLFTPAPFCRCPAPPPPPSAGSCPNSPGPVCQCASTSDLSFCTEVDYPISNVIDVATLDAFVQQAYKTGLIVFPNPSANCQANFKAFLCAFYFGECVGTQNPIAWLPCAGICPFCDCGDLAGNCTSAPVGASCTQYGSGSYCNLLE